jgi:hypothetical protein
LSEKPLSVEDRKDFVLLLRASVLSPESFMHPRRWLTPDPLLTRPLCPLVSLCGTLCQ